jgi:hypothetical protein
LKIFALSNSSPASRPGRFGRHGVPEPEFVRIKVRKKSAGLRYWNLTRLSPPRVREAAKREFAVPEAIAVSQILLQLCYQDVIILNFSDNCRGVRVDDDLAKRIVVPEWLIRIRCDVF